MWPHGGIDGGILAWSLAYLIVGSVELVIYNHKIIRIALSDSWGRGDAEEV